MSNQSLYNILLTEFAPQCDKLIQSDQYNNTQSITRNTLFKLNPIILAYLARLYYLRQHNSTTFTVQEYNDSQNQLLSHTIQCIQQYYSTYDNNDIDNLSNQLYINTLYLQIIYYSLHYTNTTELHSTQYTMSLGTKHRLDSIVELSKLCTVNKTDQIQYNKNIITLYRSIFQYMQYYNNNIHHALYNIYNENNQKFNDYNKQQHIIDHEIAAALESVFPQTGISQYLLISPGNQKYQISILVSVVHGIRLYNKYIDKGGAGINEIYNTLDKSIAASIDQVQQQLDQVNDTICSITILLQTESKQNGTITSNINILQSYLILLKQYSKYCQYSLNELNALLQQSVQPSLASYQSQLQQIQSHIGNKHSVSKELVYPLFTTLSQSYNELVQYRCRHMSLTNVIHQCEIWHKSVHRDHYIQNSDLVLADTLLKQQYGNNQIEHTDSVFDRFVTTVPHSTTALNTDCIQSLLVRHTIETTIDYPLLPVQYNGHDCIELIQYNILCTGNVQLGIIHYNNQYYTFHSIDNMKLFCGDPQYYIDQLLHTVCNKYTQLIDVLNLHHTIQYTDLTQYCQSLYNNDSLDPHSNTLCLSDKVDASTQLSNEYINTDQRVDPYYWNVWDLRRQQIQLTNITNMVTHSTQTHQSHYKRDNSSQYTLQSVSSDGTMPGVSTMTRIDKSQNTSSSQQYINGLRSNGNKSINISKVIHDDIVDEHTNNKLNTNKYSNQPKYQ